MQILSLSAHFCVQQFIIVAAERKIPVSALPNVHTSGRGGMGEVWLPLVLLVLLQVV